MKDPRTHDTEARARVEPRKAPEPAPSSACPPHSCVPHAVLGGMLVMVTHWRCIKCGQVSED